MNRVSTILISAIVIIVILIVSFVGIPALNLMLETELPSVSGDDLVDSDGDGVPDELEINGYYYEDGEFRLWNGDPNITYYRTDPTQPSTDQDPYSDGMEVSGVKMDTSVAPPGNHPLVPAYPDFYVSMTGFDVESTSEITNSIGREAQKGWSNTVTDERTKESEWGISATVKVSKSTTGWGGEVSVTGTYGERSGSKHSVTDSTSGFSLEDWEEATTGKPSEAAKIKLRVRFENRGTAAGQNIIPTVNIKLGDRTINTYELQEDKMIDTLAVNQIFPATSDWVVGDKPETLYGMHEIILTMDELKSIQLGVPIFLDIPQVDADVLAQDEEGYWKVVDTWQHYQARIDGVCARISVDLGEGNMKDYKVFARSANGPVVTLREALEWTVGCEETANGIEIMGAPVGDWRIGFSQNAYDDVEAQLAESGILDVVLDAGWTITIKAATDKDKPKIVWWESYPTGETTLVKAAVIDDFAISKVLFMTTPEATEQEMEKESEGAVVYYLELASNYTVTGEEKIIAINDRGNYTTLDIEVPRKAPIANGVYVITSVNSNKVLTVEGTIPKNESNVIQCSYAGIDSQKWKVEHIGRGDYRIMDITSGLCLEVVESKTGDNVNIQINTWQNTDNQKWAIEALGDGSYAIIAKHSKNCIDIDLSSEANGASAIQNTKSGSPSQKWILQPVASYPTVMPVMGTRQENFAILNKESGLCLQITGESADVEQYSWQGNGNQMWELMPVGDSYFKICAGNSDLCLTMENNILTLKSYDADEDYQKWRIKRHDVVDTYPSDFYFYYEIENKLSQMVLTSNGSDNEIIPQNYLGNANQKWQLIPVERYSFKNNIALTFNSGADTREGWTQVIWNVGYGNLNEPHDDCMIFLWVRGPIENNIALTLKSVPDLREGWTQVTAGTLGNLNENENDFPIFLWVRGPCKDNIVLTMSTDDATAKEAPEGMGWTRLVWTDDIGNLNYGHHSHFIYLWVR